MKRWIIMIVFAMCTALFIPQSLFAEEQLVSNVPSAILIERDTGQVLFEKNSDEKLPPASMTKIMTMLLIMEALDNKKLSYQDKVRTSEYAASMGGSQIFLEPGEEMTVEEMLKGIAIASGNDASVAMAEHLAGSHESFVKKMNEKAKELGLKHTHFMNCTGLPEKNHYSSARDMAIMAKELLKYKDITNFTSKYEDYLRKGTDKEFWLVNTNRLVKFYPGVDGLKTGFTSEAKYCLTATAKKNDMRVISVVMGAQTPKERNAQISKLLDYAFSQYETEKRYNQHDELKAMKIEKGNKPFVGLVTAENVSILKRKGEAQGSYKEKVVMKKDITLPIQKGDVLGELRIEKDKKVVSTTPLLAKEDVKEATWWQLFKRMFHSFTKVEG